MLFRPLIILIVLCCAGMLLLLRRTDRRNGRLAIPVMLGVLCWNAAIYLPNNLTHQRFFPSSISVLLLAASYIYGAILLWLFTRYPLPSRPRGIIAGCLAGLGLLWFLVVSPASVNPIDRLQLISILLRAHGWLPPLCLWTIISSVMLIASLGYASLHTRGERRLEARYLCLAMIALTGATIIQLFVHIHGTSLPDPLIPFLLCICGILLLTYTFTVRYPLIDGYRLLRPICAFSLAFCLLRLGWPAIEQPLFDWLNKALFVPQYSAHVFLFSLEIGSFLLIYSIFRRALSRFLFRDPYDERQVIARVQHTLKSVYDRQMIARQVLELIHQTFRPVSCGCYFSDEQHVAAMLAPNGETILPPELPPMHPCWQVLATYRQPELVENVPALTELFRRNESSGGCISVLIPILIADQVIGCILATEKQSGGGYTAQDMRLLTALSNEASLALENAMHFLQVTALNRELEDRVAERTKELTEAITQLTEALAAKDYFLGLVSHELLNPLTGILGWADVGLRNTDNEMRTEVMTTIRENGLRLKRLVYDLLDTARIIHGKFAIEREPTDLWYLAQATLNSVAQECKVKQLNVMLETSSETLPINGDSGRIQQVISNLLTNAIKFTPVGGMITLLGSRTETECLLSIRDTGKGIPPERLDRIFDVFQQVPGDERAGGLGLGLALVRGIIQLHEGSVRVESAGPGQGSTFTIILPLVTLSLTTEEDGEISGETIVPV